MTTRNVLPFRQRPLQLRSIVAKLVAAGVSPTKIAAHIGIPERELRDWLTTPGTTLSPKAQASLTTYVRNLRKILAKPERS